MKRLASLGLTGYDQTRRGSAPVPTPKYRGNHGGIASTNLRDAARAAVGIPLGIAQQYRLKPFLTTLGI
jgi:hypothetical protein